MFSIPSSGVVPLPIFMNASPSHTAVAPFLKHPAIAIRIGEIGEAGIVSARGVEAGCEASVPGSNGRLVPDLTDIDPTFEQTPPRGFEVGDDEIDVGK